MRTHLIVLVAAALALAGCMDRELATIAPCGHLNPSAAVRPETLRDVDLLFVVDDSRSMRVEQRALAAQVDRMVTMLTTGDLDGDGERDQPPVHSLRVGVVSTDMGGHPSCGEGDGGAFVDGTFLTFEDGDRPERFARLVSEQVDSLGTGGCAVEQPLEASLAALRPERGMLRDDSILAVVVLTDEDDCSGYERLGLGDEQDETTCARRRDDLLPISRYVDGLLALRDDPSRVVFAAISGVDPDVPSHLDAAGLDGLVESQERRLAAMPADATTAPRTCESADSEDAFRFAHAPLRILQTAQGLSARGAQVTVDSICEADYADAIHAVAREIGDALGYACLPRPMHAGADGLVDCRVLEVLPADGPITRCEQIADRGRVPFGSEDGREVCLVQQVTGPEAGAGWYYDGGAAAAAACGELRAHAITYTLGAESTNRATVRAECVFVQAFDGHAAPATGPDVGSACATDGECGDLVCDPESLTCQVGCASDADCPGGHVCSPNGASDVPICINPTCS